MSDSPHRPTLRVGLYHHDLQEQSRRHLATARLILTRQCGHAVMDPTPYLDLADVSFIWDTLEFDKRMSGVSPDRVQAYRAEILAFGLMDPLVLCRCGSLFDGWHRFLAIESMTESEREACGLADRIPFYSPNLVDRDLRPFRTPGPIVRWLTVPDLDEMIAQRANEKQEHTETALAAVANGLGLTPKDVRDLRSCPPDPIWFSYRAPEFDS